VLIGLLLVRRSAGRVLIASGLTTVAVLLAYDLYAYRLGDLFRVRAVWVAGEFAMLGIGLGLGAILVLGATLLRMRDPLWDRFRDRRGRAARLGLEAAGLAVVILLAAVLWPTYSAFSRDVGPSGYPQATEVSLDIIRAEERLEYTFVGVSEQFQEVAFNGWHVEAWVFAKDVTFSDARDPSYELPIPTDRVYIFVEKEVFSTPESPPVGPTEEYYRERVKRERIMQRMLLWAEEYRRVHGDMEIYYDDPQIRVYRIARNVDVDRANRDTAFGPESYVWRPGEYFSTDEDITADRVRPRPEHAFDPWEFRPPGAAGQ
jgi:hypothetical protein